MNQFEIAQAWPTVGDVSREPRDQASRVEDRRSVQQLSFSERYVPRNPTKVGSEPDYRFTMANERTFLAWIRTALALSAAGLGIVNLLPNLRGSLVLGLGMMALSFLTSASAFRRWALSERAMRLSQPLPPSRLPRLMAVGTALVAVVAAFLIILD